MRLVADNPREPGVTAPAKPPYRARSARAEEPPDGVTTAFDLLTKRRFVAVPDRSAAWLAVRSSASDDIQQELFLRDSFCQPSEAAGLAHRANG